MLKSVKCAQKYELPNRSKSEIMNQIQPKHGSIGYKLSMQFTLSHQVLEGKHLHHMLMDQV